MCANTFLYRCAICQETDDKNDILNHVRVVHLFEQVECSSAACQAVLHTKLRPRGQPETCSVCIHSQS
jgi:hypothetical protein